MDKQAKADAAALAKELGKAAKDKGKKAGDTADKKKAAAKSKPAGGGEAKTPKKAKKKADPVVRKDNHRSEKLCMSCVIHDTPVSERHDVPGVGNHKEA